MDSQIISLNKELQDMREKYNELRNGNAFKNHLNDDTSMCERHEANYNQSEDTKDRNSHDSFFYQSFHDPNDSEKSLTELNNDVRNDLEDFKRLMCCISTSTTCFGSARFHMILSGYTSVYVSGSALVCLHLPGSLLSEFAALSVCLYLFV
ncbi:hypothetical protein Tco_0849616 [Tanacetum coccineum]